MTLRIPHHGAVSRHLPAHRAHRVGMPAAPRGHGLVNGVDLDAIDAQMPDVNPAPGVGGEWPVDHARALADAKRFLAQVDFSKTNLVLWVPGTDNHGVRPSLARQLTTRFSPVNSWVGAVPYEASWNMRPSIATGLRSMRLILAAIAARGGDHRVLIAGESQGAWVIGEAVADPTVGGVVTRAVLMGHPINAGHHFSDGHDPRVTEINDPLDKVAMPVWGDLRTAMEAVVALHHPGLGDVPTILAAAVQNPVHTVLTGVEIVRTFLPSPLKELLPDPHNYDDEMILAANWLWTGRA